MPLIVLGGLLGLGALAALRFQKVAVQVQSAPQGASVSLDGRKVGVTPLKLSLPRPARGILKLEAADHVPVTHELLPGEKNLDFILEPLPKPILAPVVQASPRSDEDKEPQAQVKPKLPPTRSRAQKTSPPRKEGKSKGDVFDQIR